MDKAYEKYGQALDIEPLHVHKYIQALNANGIENYVAPYEADAQCAWFALNGMVGAVATNDTDLILYDVPVVLYDTKESGSCRKFEFKKFATHSFVDGLTKNQFFQACVLAGSEYIRNVTNRTDLQKACELLKDHHSYQQVLDYLDSRGQGKGEAYRDRIVQTLCLRRHQRVYDTKKEDIASLTTLAEDGTDTDYLGPSMPKGVAELIAKGLIDPKTKLPFSLVDGVENFLGPSVPTGIAEKLARCLEYLGTEAPRSE